MKLATLKNGIRDGQLVVVSKDLSQYADASTVAPTLQAALDDWASAAPKLEALAAQLAADEVDAKPFDQSEAHSPLPRAFQWADGSAYINHVELVRKARGAEVPESFYTDPLMYQGAKKKKVHLFDVEKSSVVRAFPKHYITREASPYVLP